MTTPPTSADEPTSAAIVAEHLGYTDPADAAPLLPRLEPTVAAVNRFVRRVQSPGPGGWADDHKVAAMMLAARLWRRRNSIDGVATLGAEGAVYVQRNDPDVAMYLQIGAYAPPVVG